MLLAQNYSESNSASQAFQARGVGWYRKHFSLPSDWNDGASEIWVFFEGSFHETTAWMNGEQLGPTHMQGYTSFALRIDNATGLRFGPGEQSENVLAVYIDASFGDGWWREGGGLFRHYSLVRARRSSHLGVLGEGVFARPSNLTRSESESESGWAGQVDAVLAVDTTLRNDEASPSSSSSSSSSTIVAQHRLLDSSGAEVVSFESSPGNAPAPGGSASKLSASVRIRGVSPWSVQAPALYTLETLVTVDGTVQDGTNTTIGFRTVDFTADSGLLVNDRHVKLRGFCDHSNFGGLGSAVSDRVNLYRAQTLRRVGGNAWRMAHNPPIQARLEITDALGMVVMDENRDYGGH